MVTRLKLKEYAIHSSALALFLILFAGCDRGSDISLPGQGPEEVVNRFYAFVSEGGPTSVGEAYKLVAKESNISEPRFREVVKDYPPGLNVVVTKSVITGETAVVDIEYKVESFFEDEYTVQTSLELTVDREANAWRVDFTGETDTQSKDTAIEGAAEEVGDGGGGEEIGARAAEGVAEAQR